MQRALELARQGIGLTSPNPHVGAVVLDAGGQLAGEGFHTYDGKKHADNGMFGEIDVKGDSGAAMPTATAHLQAYEYAFKSDGLKAGDNVVEFKNIGMGAANETGQPDRAEYDLSTQTGS